MSKERWYLRSNKVYWLVQNRFRYKTVAGWNGNLMLSGWNRSRFIEKWQKNMFFELYLSHSMQLFEFLCSKKPPWNSASACFVFMFPIWAALSQSGLKSAKIGHCRRRESIGGFGSRPRPSLLLPLLLKTSCETSKLSHTNSWLIDVKQELRGFPWSKTHVHRTAPNLEDSTRETYRTFLDGLQ